MENEIENLNEFFRFDDNNSKTSKANINNRINELEKEIKKPIYNNWELPNKSEKNSTFNSNILDSIDLLNKAEYSYIFAQFDDCILSSSLAVETLLDTILFINGKINLQNDKNVKKNELYEVNTVDGNVYYGERRNRLCKYTEKNGKWCYETLPSMNLSINKLAELCYDISDIDEKIDNNSEIRLFVIRRDTLVHANKTVLGLSEELYYIKNQRKFNIKQFTDFFIWHKSQAFNQLLKANQFISKSFKKFDELYGHS